jgi:hypothetical protein
MKITLAGIEFTDLREFAKFANELELFGVLQLREPIKDKKGSILIKEFVYIKDTSLKKLETIPDQYTSLFKVNLTNDVAARIKKALTKQILPEVQKSKNEFLKVLYSNDQSSTVSLENLINSAFYTNDIVLVLYKIMLEHPDFFQHMANMALLTLGTAIQKSTQIKLINRYAFLTGLFADSIFFMTDYWKSSNLDDSIMPTVCKLSARIAQNLNLPAQIISAQQNHFVKGVYVVDKTDKPIDINVLNLNPFLENIPRETSAEQSELIDNEDFDESIKILTECLKITRFISETYKRLGGENIAEKLLVMFTYNIEKGAFDKSIANPMIDRFKEYEKIVKRTRKIAELENKCVHPPSAWAYPKPKATQILCKNKVSECPHYTTGWDINVVQSQEAVGFIGTALKPGNYPKCALEKGLEEFKE